jgi:hypothetical protein
MVAEDQITEEIRSWSREALEKVNPSFGNMPPCPYAEKAWTSEKVGISFKRCPSFQDLTTIVSTWDDKYDVVVLVDLDYIKDETLFYQHIDGMNGAIAEGVFIEKDIWLMAYHPEEEPNELFYSKEVLERNEEIDEDEPYAMIFIQRLSKLHEASEKLEKTDYYKEYEKQHGLRDMLKVRETYYRRLKDEQ